MEKDRIILIQKSLFVKLYSILSKKKKKINYLPVSVINLQNCMANSFYKLVKCNFYIKCGLYKLINVIISIQNGW